MLIMPIKNRKSILDPIDVVTGECYQDRIDFSLTGPIPIEWKAYYSNQFKSNTPIGLGWIHSYYRYLSFQKNLVIYSDGQGGEIPFLPIPEIGNSVSSADNRSVLKRTGEYTFEILLSEGLTCYFINTPSGKWAYLEKISNLNNQTIIFKRDSNFRLTHIYDSAGRILEIKTDNIGHITSIICSRKRETPVRLVSYAYDKEGNLIEVTDANGFKHYYQYDSQHQLIKRTDRNRYSFHYRYADGRCVKTWGDDGLHSGEFIYNIDKKRTVMTGFDDRLIEYRYNDNGQIYEEIDPYGRTTKTLYDLSGNETVITDRCGRMSVKKYDDRSNKTEEMTPTGAKTAYSYNKLNHITEITDPRGQKTAYEYDDRGNLLKEQTPDGKITTHKYDDQGHQIYTHEINKMPLNKQYDQYHQLVSVRSAFSDTEIIGYEYDILGNIIKVRDNTGSTIYTYDRMSRLLSVRYPDGSFEKNTFDPEGNTTSYTDRLGNVWQYRYKAYRQMIQMIAPDGGVTKYDYTKADELCLVIDPNGNSTEYIHDFCDEVVEIKRNGLKVETYERDAEGRLLVKKDAKGQILTTLSYDNGNKPLVRIIEKNSSKIESSLIYDKNGQILSTKNDFAETEREYDPNGKIISERINDHKVTHKYDEKGRLTHTDFGNGIGFEVNHSSDNHFTITDPTGKSYECYADGKLITERWLASGLQESFEYDEEGRITQQVLSKNENYQIFNQHYDYNIEGQLVRIKNHKTERLIRYDDNSRLTGIELKTDLITKNEESFAYDPAGNMLPSGNGTKAQIQTGNQLAVWGDRHFSYDYRGGMSSESRGNEQYEYSYDSAGQLTSVKLPDGQQAKYEYDALRRRISKQIGDEKTLFGWDGDRLSWEISPNGTCRYYSYSSANEHSPFMFCESKHLADQERSLETYVIHYDQSDRPIFITDSKGKSVWSANISAYGKTSVESGSVIEYNLRAPGQYFDAETGFHYNYHRYYDPETGRYTQPDLIGLAGGLNLYAYGEGNPFAACDILGLTGG